ncbi:MAG: ABC transporter ATP-binding protein [Candidatus Riflebacteria bacterium]|nr:ABC transporter ATP-binding protein [Candidatus Riflebacteria bacterium]
MIDAESLQRYFKLPQGEVRAVDNVTMKVKTGEFVAIMGPSGSGKSTLLYVLGTMDHPTGGSLTIDGSRLDEMGDTQRSTFRNSRLGFVFQSFHLLPRLNLARNIALPMLYSRVPVETRFSRAESLLRAVGLPGAATRYPTELSGGQCQRVAIARALANSPKLILADEPTGNLDSKTGLDIMGIFQNLNDAGITLVMVTHDEVMAKHAKRVIRMLDGVIIDDSEVVSRLFAPPPAEFDSSLFRKKFKAMQ